MPHRRKYVVRYFSVWGALSLNTRLIRFVQGFERSSLTRADTWMCATLKDVVDCEMRKKVRRKEYTKLSTRFLQTTRCKGPKQRKDGCKFGLFDHFVILRMCHDLVKMHWREKRWKWRRLVKKGLPGMIPFAFIMLPPWAAICYKLVLKNIPVD